MDTFQEIEMLKEKIKFGKDSAKSERSAAKRARNHESVQLHYRDAREWEAFALRCEVRLIMMGAA